MHARVAQALAKCWPCRELNIEGLIAYMRRVCVCVVQGETGTGKTSIARCANVDTFAVNSSIYDVHLP